MEDEVQDLKEIMEVTGHILSGLDIEKIMQGVSWFLTSKYEPEKIAFILPTDIDDIKPDITYYEGITPKNKKINFVSIEPLLDYFNNVEYNQFEFKDFKKTFSDKKIIEELCKISPAYLMPLRSDKGIVGLFTLGDKKNHTDYTSDELQSIYYIIRFASIAIENSNLYQRAIIDRMTKLYTHHQFQKKLEEEISRCQRYNNNFFSIIMLDIDNFKDFNDMFGHLVGDLIIKEIAAIVSSSIRNIDFPARYGGEEFSIILPQIHGAGAFGVAERLRKIVKRHDFPNKNGETLHVTISIGVAEFDNTYVKHSSHIIDCADKALYNSKKNGKDRVTLGIYSI